MDDQENKSSKFESPVERDRKEKFVTESKRPILKNPEPHTGRNYFQAILIGSLVGVLYGLLARLEMGPAPLSILQLPFLDNNTLTYGFLGFVPLTIGALSVVFTPRGFRTRYRYTSVLTLWTVILYSGS